MNGNDQDARGPTMALAGVCAALCGVMAAIKDRLIAEHGAAALPGELLKLRDEAFRQVSNGMTPSLPMELETEIIRHGREQVTNMFNQLLEGLGKNGDAA